MVEFGPEIYGIKEAANQYFVKPPAALTVKEAAYLASVLPAPTYHYASRQKNKPLQLWKVGLILKNMYNGRTLSRDELFRAQQQPLRVIVPPLLDTP